MGTVTTHTMDTASLEERRRTALRRKEAMGRHASYTRICELVPSGRATVHAVLKGYERKFEIDRERILGNVEAALDTLEASYSDDTTA